MAIESLVNMNTVSRVKRAKKELEGRSDEDLAIMVVEGHKGMSDVPGTRFFSLRGPKETALISLPEDHPIYLGMAAYQILEERRGEEFAMGLIGVRPPKGLVENLRYFIKDELPKNPLPEYFQKIPMSRNPLPEYPERIGLRSEIDSGSGAGGAGGSSGGSGGVF